MKPASAYTIALLLLALTMGSPLAAQEVFNLANAPFTATQLYTHNGKATGSMELARASDGSTYELLKDNDGHIAHIRITDVPNSRIIWLYPSPPSYTYRVVPASSDGKKIRAGTVERQRDMLQHVQDRIVQNPNDGRVVLGVVRENGMTIFGTKSGSASASGEQHTDEIWQSDLGITIKRIATDSGPKEGVSVTNLTNLRRAEPDPRLFEIPAEYLPHPDPLLDGKKVFVDNETGIPEVKDAAVATFSSNVARWVVTDSREDADLVAVFANVLRTEDTDPPFEMRIHVPRSDTILFVSHLRRNPNALVKSYLAYEKGLAMSCVSDLWTRVANTHIGLVNSQAVVSKVQNTP